MRGTTPRRMQGLADPVLSTMVRDLGLEEVPHYVSRSEKVVGYTNRWVENASVLSHQ